MPFVVKAAQIRATSFVQVYDSENYFFLIQPLLVEKCLFFAPLMNGAFKSVMKFKKEVFYAR